jgi:formylglycine-generating enzyme required for sulfatase activity
VDVLLWLWERRKEDERRPADLLTLLQEARVDRTFFVRALDKLAFDVHQAGGAQEGTADIRASTLERRLEVLHPDRDPSWARRVATFIRERAGLLVERQADVLDPVLAFPHRTFQEYLAACWLTEGEDTARKAAELACTGDHWWEVIKLAAGRLLYVERKISQPLLLLDWLCPPGTPVGEDRWRMALLAGEVLLELKPEQMLREEALRPQVEDRLDQVLQRLCRLLRESKLTARERAEGGNILAQLGDPRFREDAWFLPDEPLLGFVEIPEGPFLMGSDKERDPMAYDDELPQHKVDLPAYYVARYPVTVAQFRAFVEDSGYEPGDPDSLRGVSNHPVVRVTWHEALKYCDWLTERLRAWDETPEPLATLLREEGWAIILPSEAEWEKAARGTDGRIFPWGEQADPERANYNDTGIGTTSAVGCFPDGASPYEVEDLSGNVWEWTRSLWGTDLQKPDFGYPYDSEDGREDLRAADEIRRVLRGGAFYSDETGVRCACRRYYPFPRFRNLGFRVVASPVRSDL